MCYQISAAEFTINANEVSVVRYVAIELSISILCFAFGYVT